MARSAIVAQNAIPCQQETKILPETKVSSETNSDIGTEIRTEIGTETAVKPVDNKPPFGAAGPGARAGTQAEIQRRTHQRRVGSERITQ
jgi:hypothetical protein